MVLSVISFTFSSKIDQAHYPVWVVEIFHTPFGDFSRHEFGLPPLIFNLSINWHVTPYNRRGKDFYFLMTHISPNCSKCLFSLLTKERGNSKGILNNQGPVWVCKEIKITALILMCGVYAVLGNFSVQNNFSKNCGP